MMAELNDKIRNLPVVNILGKDCWTPGTVAKAVNMHRNTVNNWIRLTRQGKLDLPMLGAPTKKAKTLIPVDEFLAWYRYTQN